MIALFQSTALEGLTADSMKDLMGQAIGGIGLPFVVVGLWVLLLAVFTGFELINKVPPTLHTPLMSGSNAISGITLVGALYCAGIEYPGLARALGVLAIALATINVIGGFMVTDRMLSMFGSRKPAKRAPDAKSEGTASK